MNESRGLFLFFSLSLLACSSSKDTPAEVDAAVDSGVVEETAVDSFPESGGCSSARETALKPIDSVSTGTVTALAGGVYVVDASAGGFDAAASNPWIYVSLSSGMRVDLTDKQAFTSADWDLGLKRAVLRTNDGDSGPGGGGAQFVAGKSFDSVTMADATKLVTESWFDADCNPKTDA
ncbi:MAG: HmuY family protein, partial [Polyangiales bacterium]